MLKMEKEKISPDDCDSASTDSTATTTTTTTTNNNNNNSNNNTDTTNNTNTSSAFADASPSLLSTVDGNRVKLEPETNALTQAATAINFDFNNEDNSSNSNKKCDDDGGNGKFKKQTEKKTAQDQEQDSGEKTEVKLPHPPTKKAGFAEIKQEFLLLNYKPKIQTEFLSEDSKRKLAEISGEKEKDEVNSEPPNKKAKLKGRNKNRPRTERIDEKDKLCPAIREDKECKFGDSCKFNHDVKDYFSKKPADIGSMCPVYEKFGLCKHGISCRWANSHLGENLDNVINTDLYDKMRNVSSFVNSLSEDVRNKLWKRKYNFDKSKASLKASQSIAYDGQQKQNCQNNSAVVKSETVQKSQIVMENDGSCNAGDNESAVCSQINEDLSKMQDDGPIRLTPREVKKIDFRDKLYLAPLTTAGNLPFRRVCKDYGVDITCSEMALASSLLKGKYSEWSLIKRHPCEDIFGVQLCGPYPDMMTNCAQLLSETSDIDFIDINCGCPIDLIFKKGCGSALMGKASKLEHMCRSMIGVMGDMPLTVKLRTGIFGHKNVAHNLIPRLKDAGVSLVTIHGRSREQRYTKLADWEYVNQCSALADPMPVFGNGDILSFEDANRHMTDTGLSGVMIARGALIKPWIFTEIKEQRHWDISSSERFDMLKSYTNYGLEHWGSDQQGVETTRRFMLEWISFLHRYIPVGVLEQVPQKINERPPYYVGRNDLETMMASPNCADWIKISEMLLGPVPPSFQFLPKHKANAYQ